ncbi:MAG: hypothetical protein OXR07_08970, partial [Nitrospira sp.]|nr:hypothetical protein [Nitrospira sp.]
GGRRGWGAPRLRVLDSCLRRNDELVVRGAPRCRGLDSCLRGNDERVARVVICVAVGWILACAGMTSGWPGWCSTLPWAGFLLAQE